MTFEHTINAPALPLNSGYSLPQLGYGLYKVPEVDARGLVTQALQLGYRHLDSAALYGNEAGVGLALESAFEAGLNRQDVFVTSKVWNTDQGYESTLAACQRSLSDLRLDYLDLYLIHWPCPERDLFVETWRALEELVERGLVRSIGVSNFRVQDLEKLMQYAQISPAVNQVELHPWLQQRELRAVHEQLGMVTEAWSPLARGALVQDGELAALAGKYGVSAAQLVLRWHMQSGIATFPKASSAERMAQNADVFGFELSADDMAIIAGMDRGYRSGSHPDQVN